MIYLSREAEPNVPGVEVNRTSHSGTRKPNQQHLIKKQPNTLAERKYKRYR